jgi:hypothetical protein
MNELKINRYLILYQSIDLINVVITFHHIYLLLSYMMNNKMLITNFFTAPFSFINVIAMSISALLIIFYRFRKRVTEESKNAMRLIMVRLIFAVSITYHAITLGYIADENWSLTQVLGDDKYINYFIYLLIIAWIMFVADSLNYSRKKI